MRLLTGVYENFGSYKKLEFNFSNLGLTLISGPTGSGKSTLMDACAWVLFGQTSKEGSVDEVKQWGADEPTIGTQEVELPGGSIIVTRVRGKATQNDLYWVESGGDEPKRGKDINETQKLLETRLGVSADLYFQAAYFSQFSRADSFFTAKAKERRETLEKISDLSLPIRLGDASSNERRTSKDELRSTEQAHATNTGRATAIRESLQRVSSLRDKWTSDSARRREDLLRESRSFEETKRSRLAELDSTLAETKSCVASPEFIEDRIKQNKNQRVALDKVRDELAGINKTLAKTQADLDLYKRELKKHSTPGVEICPTCLGPAQNTNRKKHLSAVEKKIDNISFLIEEINAEIKSKENTLSGLKKLETQYEQLLKDQRDNQEFIHKVEELENERKTIETEVNESESDLRREEEQRNPYDTQLEQLHSQTKEVNDTISVLSSQIDAKKHRITSLTQLYDLSMLLRGKLLEKSVSEIELSTNNYLQKYFDGEIKVEFNLDADKLDISIQKNGYSCSFKQLSGGQRTLLKLSFGVSLMKAAANTAAVDFSCIFLDESLNGLDDGLKEKAFGLLQELENEHESIVVIDHCEAFKSLFSNQFQVCLEGDQSTIVHIEGADEQSQDYSERARAS